MSDIVKFGKYKGQPLEILLKDTDYVKWCQNNGMFEKFKLNIGTVVVNNNVTMTKDEPTPAHNKLQNMFLDNDFVKKFISMFVPIYNFNINEKSETINYELSVEFESTFNWDVVIDKTYDFCLNYVTPGVSKHIEEVNDLVNEIIHAKKTHEETRDAHIGKFNDEYGNDKCKDVYKDNKMLCSEFRIKSIIKNYGDRCLTSIKHTNNLIEELDNNFIDKVNSIKLLVVKKTTEQRQIKPSITNDKFVNVGHEYGTKKNKDVDKELISSSRIWSERRTKYYLEIKTTVGDEYPCILRKMKDQIEKTKNQIEKQKNTCHDTHYNTKCYPVLIIDNFKAESCTKLQLVEIFKRDNIRVVFFEDIPEQPITETIIVTHE